MSTHDAPDPEIIDGPDGRFLRWRFAIDAFAVGDYVKFPCRSKVATLTLLELVDPADSTVTTFTPRVGVKDGFVADSIDERTFSATSDAPSRSQSPVALNLPGVAFFVKPVPSAGPITVQISCVVRDGHRI